MDRMASIELALKNEETEMKFYLNEAQRSKNALARAMFRQLAKDEEEHMTRIRNLHTTLVRDGDWPKDVAIEVAGTNVKDILDELVGKEGSAKDHSDDDLKALEKSADFEAKGSKFYADLAEQCENYQERRFFEFLSGIEREHQLSVVDSIGYLKDPEAWLMQHGRAGLDGA